MDSAPIAPVSSATSDRPSIFARSRVWIALLAAALIAAPMAALTDAPPKVVLAIPGSAGGAGGAIDRFTIRFSEAMVPLGDPRATPPISMKCAVSGTGRWVDPQTFVHEFVKTLPGGITCQAKLRNGLASARGVAVAGGMDFTIDTGGPTARAVLPGQYDGDIEEDQIFLVASNVPATRASVASAGYCAVDGIGEKIALDVLAPETGSKLLADLGKDSWEVRNFLEEAGLPEEVPVSAADRKLAYAAVSVVKCRRPLPPGKDVALVWGADIVSADGRRAGTDERFDFTVRKDFSARFECSRVNPRAGCNPMQPVKVRFTADIPRAQADQVRLVFPDGTSLKPVYDSEDKNDAFVSDLEFAKPLPSAVTAKVVIPAGLSDESGRKLSNASRFPLDVRIDAPPPLVKFAADFGILEAKEGGILPVTVRAVEPELGQQVSKITGETLKVAGSDGQIAQWLRHVSDYGGSDFRTETIKGEEVEVNYTGTKSLLRDKGKPGSVETIKLGLPGKGKDFEVVGIPLSQPGFYVVELASPALGAALLGRPATRYVSAAALVTNMSVHFKWGRESSLAWVTALDTGAVVPGAEVRVTDSCTGVTLASGQTDSVGRVLFARGLPEPETYSNCASEEGSHPLMVSARSGADFSFTLTDWDDGIAPDNFELSFGYSAPDDIVHTIFDRSLVREGEEINMKHVVRKPVGAGFTYGKGFTGKLVLSHSGSGTEFELPVTIGRDGIGENKWKVPKGAPQGDYNLSFVLGKDKTVSSYQSFRVDEYRLPTMRATVTGPKQALVRPSQIPLDLFVGFLSGGGASGLPVSVRTDYELSGSAPEGWDDWSFGGSPAREGLFDLAGNSEELPAAPMPLAQTLPATLGGDGTAKVAVQPSQPITDVTRLSVEMDYEDANGETLTAARSFQLFPSAVQLGIKTDGWLMRDSDLRLQFVTLDADGNAVKGRPVKVDVYSREVLTSRRRLIGGFYAYDNKIKVTKLGATCSAVSGKDGKAACTLAPGVSGEVTVVASTTDNDGNTSYAVSSVWLAGDKEWWFGGDNGDRMDVVPEANSYPANGIAKFQVRMPFREATALVTVEREGVLSSFVTQLSGKDPVVSVPLNGSHAPNIHVSVMAVRGRVTGFKQWVTDKARDLGLPFTGSEGGEPTALVDLSKPAYRIGMARIDVGWEGHKLDVAVKSDKKRYAVRETAQVDVAVKGPGGKPPASAEIAFAAVDESLLQLSPNDSWKLIDAMMGSRPVSVLTSTAQMQVVGKRHYGKKAVEAGGGGGADQSAVERDDFRPVLLWQGRVNLDASGRARIAVPMSESLSSFRLVAIANAGADLFGTGETSVRTAQDLQLFSGLPPLVRTGDSYSATFTVRNGTDKAMKVTANASATGGVSVDGAQSVEIPAGGAAPLIWAVTAPATPGPINWTVEVNSGKAKDRIAVSQDVAPAIPVETWAATLARVGTAPIPVMAPAGSLPGSAVVDVRLTDTLAPPLSGVRSYMGDYPYSCFEQRLSRSVVLGDGPAWTQLADEIPAYMDNDGLLRYFPIGELKGSEALTAYVLSMTAEAGYVIPPAPRLKMLDAMKAVVAGRLEREFAWGGDARLLRIAALAALARNGSATPGMLGSISIAPSDMPTTALTDWLTAIDRTKGANAALRAEAERTLRQRLVYEGSRLDLADQSRAPWWMMSTGDEMAIKALLAALGRPGWQDDSAKMMVGVALRQQRGHWDTTTANAWGTIAARRFGTLYPATAIMGTTSVALGGQTLSQSWPMAADAGPLRLKAPDTQMPLTLTQSGGSGPWAMVSVLAAVPLQQPLFAGYKLTKEVTVVSRKVAGQLTRGDVVKVRLTVDSAAERNWVVINDPVPPGATIIGGLGGQSALLAREASGGEGIWPSYVERKNDSWRGYFEWVPRGRLVTEYVMRVNGAGDFRLPPTRVEAMYSPDIRAQVPNAPVRVALR